MILFRSILCCYVSSLIFQPVLVKTQSERIWLYSHHLIDSQEKLGWMINVIISELDIQIKCPGLNVI